MTYCLQEKDVKTPLIYLRNCFHAVNGVANRRGTRGAAAADAFEATFSTTASAQSEHIQATADTAAKIRVRLVAVRIVDGIVQNKYATDPGKLAAWISAKHVEKDPTKKAPPTP